MANPFKNGLQNAPNSATAPRNSVNDPNTHNRLTHNTFDKSYDFYVTERYGDITPFYVEDSVAGDKNPLYSTHELKAYTLKSPLMTGLSKKKGYFAVPYKALLPFNFDKVFVNPKKGSDVPDNASTVFDFPVSILNDSLRSFVVPNSLTELNFRLKYILLLESFFSSGSLLHCLGYKISNSFRFLPGTFVEDDYSFDKWFDVVFADFFRTFDLMVLFPSIGDDGSIFRNFSNDQQLLGTKVSNHRLLELMRDNPDFEVYSVNGLTSAFDSEFTTFWNDVSNDLHNAFVHLSGSGTAASNGYRLPFDYSRLLAYQISSCVFFSNDDVDDIYTANLYRQNIESLFSFPSFPSFVYNGVTTRYDVLSGYVVSQVLGASFANLPTLTSDSDIAVTRYCALTEIFFFRKSLRFADYFNGARLSPLAVGDINAPVVNNNVNAIDMTRSIAMQRFTNFVNKIPSTIAGYLRDMFHVTPAVDLTEPSYLAVTKSNIGGFLVENTSNDNQGKLVTNLSSNDGDFAFEVDVEDPCIIIGLSWYEMPQIYSSTIERQMLHVDRYDKFQPMLQYIGDQMIYGVEKNSRMAYSEPYAYTLRNMEYKQRYHQASGAFVVDNNLSSWANIVDSNHPDNAEAIIDHLDSYVIRARNYEFDRFYSSLTGFSLGTYFHFIVKYMNKNNVTRPMAVAPEILG